MMDKYLLYKYFAGETCEEEEKQLMDWAESDPENYQAYLKERKCWNALLVNTDREFDPFKAGTKKKTSRIWIFSAVAASFALLFILSQRFIQEEQPAEKWQSIWVPPGQRAQITLDDGTSVWLNSRSTLIFPATFVSGKRTVKLNGEAYFDVEKDTEHPFIVQTGKYDIEVLGTSFNVLAYEGHDFFETSLLNGSVQINSPVRNTPVATLKPNERIHETNGRLLVSAIDNPDHFRWREGLICLDDERFEDLVQKFSLYFDIRIIIENKKLLDYRCTGKFRQSDGVDYALKVLQAEMKFSYTRDNERNEIVIQ
ncbi:MAG: FecR domain-containing protein [Tannerellaceae bacterium]|jgi:ferric-dicitrate binding protein FerR (iron transport regulator)|nr:FecR domain-containing protein [Tannerellaceae bacterium]